MRYVKELKYGFHVIFHPFNGFWELKREHRGSLAAALTFVGIFIMLTTFGCSFSLTLWLFILRSLGVI